MRRDANISWPGWGTTRRRALAASGGARVYLANAADAADQAEARSDAACIGAVQSYTWLAL